MIAKLLDAGGMLWECLDGRERLIVAAVAVAVAAVCLDAAGRSSERRREERVAVRAAQLVREGR